MWSWPVALYLWLAALGAGVFLVAILADRLSPEGDEKLLKMAVLVSAPCFLVALIALALQLQSVFVVGLMLEGVVLSSGVSLAFWSLLACLFVSFPLLLLRLAEVRDWPMLPGESVVRPVLVWLYAATCALALLSAAWLLIGTSDSLWSSSYLLAELLVVSAALCGVATVLGLSRTLEADVSSAVLRTLSGLQPILLVIQACLLVVVLVHIGLQPSAAPALLPFLTLSLAAVLLWVGSLLGGVVVPLAIELWIGPARGWDFYPSRLLAISPALVVTGAFSLRLAFVFAGQG